MEIDQSGKVEKSGEKTVVADSLGHVIVIRSRDKKKIQSVFRQAGRPRMYVYELFSVLVASVIRMSYQSGVIYVVDTEYLHQDGIIRSLILRSLKKFNIHLQKDELTFLQIGRKSKAHDHAYRSYRQKRGAKYITIEKVLRLLSQ